MYNQPNGFYVSKVLDYESTLLDTTPYQFSGFTTVSAVCAVHKDWSWSSPPAKEVRHATRDVASLSQGIRRLCGELMLLQKAVLEARGFKPNLFDKW
jgi:hypothetical protein